VSDADPTEDPRELARRLAEQAKHRVANAASEAPAEDPRELARRLAEQAKARAAAAPAKTTISAQISPADPPKRSLADRASKPLSPQEAMRLAIEEEKREELARKVVVTRSTLKPAAPAQPAAASAPAAPVAPVAPVAPAIIEPAPASLRDPAALVSERLAGAHVLRVLPVTNRVVFQALWQAHRARASAEGDITLLVSADALLDAAGRLPEGALFAAELSWRGEAWAVWLDAARGALLAAARRPELLLAGL
jgi:hypothetical protein